VAGQAPFGAPAAAMAEAGDLLIPMAEGLIAKGTVFPELGEIIAGRRKGRESPAQVTLFKSVGVAVQDLVAADKVLANAARLNLGTELAL